MKIMDTSGDDECQVEAVVNSTAKKSKQGRLPFQTLAADSPVANKKKRKSTASPDVRKPKQAKVNTKENSFKGSEKTETNDIVIIEEKEENSNETTDVKDNTKQASDTEVVNSKSKKATPGNGTPKNKKTETKIQASPLTKFFKKIDSKDTQSDVQTSTPQKGESKSTKKDDVDCESKDISDKSENKKEKSTEKEKVVKDTSKVSSKSKSKDDSDHHKKDETKNVKKLNKSAVSVNVINVDSEESQDEKKKDHDTSHESKEAQENTSQLTETDCMDIDSESNLTSDDDHEDDKSDTDSKKTEHEDTDSRDDVNLTNISQDAKNKLLNSDTKEKKLTPKQIKRKEEMQKKREGREKQRMEREKKLQEERESRKKEKEEKKRKREEEEKAAKEQKKKEKEEKELKKQMELEQKQKEKEAKEEDRRKREEAKEEEKRRKEEEKLEAERKKQKAATNFVNFFVPKKPSETKPVEEEKKVEVHNFMPFEIKADMRVAPVFRRNLSESEKSKFEDLFTSSNVEKSKLYISEIKSSKTNIRKSGKTWPYEVNDDVTIIEGDDEDNSNVVQASSVVREKHRAKLFFFHENRRPPYWGTWRKKSKTIKPRRPLATDKELFDYEIDSDDEWEEEEPGESLHGSDDEKEKDEETEENDYDIDNDFMVPHGYLSEEEIMADEEDEEDDLNPENQKKKLKILGEQFEAERNTKTKKLKPKIIGCVWLSENNTYPENTPANAIQFLTSRQIWAREIPFTLTAPADADSNECGTPSSKQGVAMSALKTKALEEVMPDLIRLVHGNLHSMVFLIKEFLEHYGKKNEGGVPISKMKLKRKIQEVASYTSCPDPGAMQHKQCWYVNEEIRKKYFGEEKLPLPNNWTYNLTPKKRNIIVEVAEEVEEKDKEKDKEKKTVPLITQFTKTLTAEEMQRQLAEKAATPGSKVIEKPSASTSAAGSAAKATPPLNRPPKRATLISGPRGEPLPKSPRISLMDKFVTKDAASTSSTDDRKKGASKKYDDLDDDDCVMIEDDSDDSKGATDPGKSVSENKSKDDSDVSMKDEEKTDNAANVSNNSDVEVVEI